MSTACYVPKAFGPAALDIIEKANEICADYQRQGFQLTLRQLYYQFVSRAFIANKDTEYKRLGGIINDARLAGLISWDYLEDRTRNLQGNNHWDDPKQIVDAVAKQYRNALWSDQDFWPEVWVEKEALAGVVERSARALDVDYFSCRGYVSQSEMYAAAQRLRQHIDKGQQPVIIHLGDHDPSGIDMTRDITERLNMFVCDPEDWQSLAHHAQEEYAREPHDLSDEDLNELWNDWCYGNDDRPHVEVRRIALNMPQIRQYNPPPNPAKVTDSRATEYIKRYGSSSWELDALDPATLDALIRAEVETLRDEEKWSKARAKQERDRHHLTLCSRNWTALTEHLDGQYGEYEE